MSLFHARAAPPDATRPPAPPTPLPPFDAAAARLMAALAFERERGCRDARGAGAPFSAYLVRGGGRGRQREREGEALLATGV